MFISTDAALSIRVEVKGSDYPQGQMDAFLDVVHFYRNAVRGVSPRRVACYCRRGLQRVIVAYLRGVSWIGSSEFVVFFGQVRSDQTRHTELQEQLKLRGFEDVGQARWDCRHLLERREPMQQCLVESSACSNCERNVLAYSYRASV